jgi:ligand-binding sensor domain-containing protein
MKRPSGLQNTMLRIFILIMGVTVVAQGVPITHAPNKGTEKMIKTQGSTQYDNVHCSRMDRDGNLWFATTGEGIYKYDGHVFTQFTLANGLSSNCVYTILLDNAGNLWAGTKAGLCKCAINKLEGKCFSPVNLPLPSGPSSSSVKKVFDSANAPNEVFSLIQDKKGDIWIAASAAVYCYDGKSFDFFLDRPGLNNKEGVSLSYVQCMLEDQLGNIWFGSGPMAFEGVALYDGKTLHAYKPNGETWMRYLLQDKEARVWFGTRHQGVWYAEGASYQQLMDGKDLGLTDGDIGLAALCDNAGNIWFSGGETENGINQSGGIYRYDGKEFSHFTEKDGINNFSVWSILEDKEGNIWFGTRNNGLYRYNAKISAFTSFSE